MNKKIKSFLVLIVLLFFAMYLLLPHYRFYYVNINNKKDIIFINQVTGFKKRFIKKNNNLYLLNGRTMYSRIFLSASVRSYLWTEKDLVILIKQNPKIKESFKNKNYKEILKVVNDFNIRKKRKCSKVY